MASYISPDVDSHQGYATDGRWHFTFDTTRLAKREYASWAVVTENTEPFGGLHGLNHLGDGDYYRGNLYLPAERWVDCKTPPSRQTVLVFSADTLMRIQAYDISHGAHEASGIAIDKRTGVAYVSSFCDGSKLFTYDLDTFEPVGLLPLSRYVPNIQGIALRGDWLYAASDNIKVIHAIHAHTGHVEAVLTANLGHGFYQGLDYSLGELRWLIDKGPGNKRVYYFPTLSEPYMRTNVPSIDYGLHRFE